MLCPIDIGENDFEYAFGTLLGDDAIIRSRFRKPFGLNHPLPGLDFKMLSARFGTAVRWLLTSDPSAVIEEHRNVR